MCSSDLRCIGRWKESIFLSVCGSQRGKTKSLRGCKSKLCKHSKRAEQEMPGSILFAIGVLSNDFADVDVREELCYHSRPKKQNSETYLFVRFFTLFFIIKTCFDLYFVIYPSVQ